MRSPVVTTRRGILVLVALPAIFFTTIALLPRHELGFSEVHRSNIEHIAAQICRSEKVEPCPLQLGGKSKWFGTLAPQGAQSVASVEYLRNALPLPEWSVTEAPMEYELTNGKYTVTYVRASGSIVITSSK